ncbi:MAG: GTPase ObgE [Chlamydiae bacterium]|nr:GTPase ObgE [Chlamydiota bacterium]
MFTDSLTLTLSAGKGGNGVVAWRREKYIPKGGPTGGNGGRGASITLRASNQIPSLEGMRNKRIIKAENGSPGGSNLIQGRSGKNLIITIPCGTLIKDKKTKEVLFDFTEDGQEWIICKGGKGGKGNHHFKSSTHQAPNIFTEGTYGESKDIELELKLIADIGLLGMPNAGKSTLMSTITYVAVKVAPYPFTTLYPNLGFVQYPDKTKVLVADVPGIIKDAHTNKGLGISFLKHIERTSLIIYVIDISGFEGRDPVEDFLILKHELASYKETMLQKPFYIVLNKIDMEGAQDQVDNFKKEIPVDPSIIFTISAKEKHGLTELIAALKAAAPAPKIESNEPVIVVDREEDYSMWELAEATP